MDQNKNENMREILEASVVMSINSKQTLSLVYTENNYFNYNYSYINLQ